MRSQLRVPERLLELLRCPTCHAELAHVAQEFVCRSSECDTHFPIIEGVPILLNEKASIFSIDDLIARRDASHGNVWEQKTKKAINRLIPKVSRNIKARANYNRFSELLFRQSAFPRVLVLGGRILGQGMESLADNASLDLVESDVSLGPRTMLVCDAHDVPFKDRSFDGVVIQAVLEHVVDPYRCVEEIHRVLQEQGIVYAETPFMQQVHAGRYDFTRFTHLGHRRLFRKFEEVDSGAVSGPAAALAWSYQQFLLAFTTSRALRVLLGVFSRLTSFYLQYFDGYLIKKPGALDSACAYYFMGRKGEHVLTDQELIELYKGAFRSGQRTG